jgi:chromosome segregation ATPase
MTQPVAAALSYSDTIATLAMANAALVVTNEALVKINLERDAAIAAWNATAVQLRADIEVSEKRREELEEYYEVAESRRALEAELKVVGAKLKEDKAKLQKEKEDHILTKAALAKVNKAIDDGKKSLELKKKKINDLEREIEQEKQRRAGATAPGKVAKKRRQSARE